MEIIIAFAAITVFSTLAARYGSDSRRLSDRSADRDALWSRGGA